VSTGWQVLRCGGPPGHSSGWMGGLQPQAQPQAASCKQAPTEASQETKTDLQCRLCVSRRKGPLLHQRPEAGVVLQGKRITRDNGSVLRLWPPKAVLRFKPVKLLVQGFKNLKTLKPEEP
jgi:hypothetical protein